MTQTQLTVVGADRAASQQDAQLLSRAQVLLAGDPNFQALKTPVLSRAEVNAGLPDSSPGYLYLRFDVPGAVPQEFWAHWSSHDKVAWKGGHVSVARDKSSAPKGSS
ncbi:MAG: hypothetical protein ACR2J4_01965 [Deinococcus sp.]